MDTGEAQTASFTAFFCCFDVMNSKCAVLHTQNGNKAESEQEHASETQTH